MSIQDNKTLVRLFFEAQNQADIAAFRLFMAPELIWHGGDLGTIQGFDAWKRHAVEPYFVAFPDLYQAVEDMVAEGDRVALRWTAQGTHKGPLWGIPPSGQRVSWTGTTIYRIADGKVAERWGVVDQLGLLQQLGGVPK